MEDILEQLNNKEISFFEALEELEEHVEEERNNAFSEGYHRGFHDAKFG